MNNGCIKLCDVPCLDLDITLDCGQAFRWNKKSDGRWAAVVSGRMDGKPCSLYAELSQEIHKDKKTGLKVTDICVYGATEEEIDKFWKPYFDANRKYDDICKTLRADNNINCAIDEFYGIRILNQDPWETLCSFIISQNNNIPRIKGIIDRLCENFGKQVVAPCEDYPNGLYSFPSSEDLASLEPDDLAPLRAGFRNKYIIDAARKVASGEVDLEKIRTLPLAEAEAELIKIKGVGCKVAQCALLYGFGQIDAFPVDVWVKRIMSEMYPDGLHPCTAGIRGIAQQYLFHWRRNSLLTKFE